ncbi:threonine/serine exporter family protein [Tetragenococcus koreensis]|uniref:Membrane protein n=1 Tax=Tetragenococcus koreensis TaxID=290335 RepID=A0AAN4ZRN5_9ENTE|nr:threonine/serine exporter family protein [Tetragenococcus koreensis]AYW44589.1 threonine/serine exporter [Tetragenococcus koreensis]MCF1584557.1 threonine/serine exporter family protein [Tetragenococcus koreensis]MCF1614106.1 threonine/serine exporter family protein [Tetragenococcus koreensis]MCF1617488.1 threonine/serine exporter family protein [Tetragenococcus koreensis]MCF1619285.1 threonine/serine exporter family protein [Tetragenococcus koreensis]
MTFILQFSLSFLSSAAFGIIANIPRRALWTSGFTGAIGWIIYFYLRQSFNSIALSNFAAAFIIGCLSIFFSKKQKMPMIIFYIPSLVPLVPGGPSYEAVRAFVLGDSNVGSEKLMFVVTTAISIVGGLLMTSLVEQIINKRIRARKN